MAKSEATRYYDVQLACVGDAAGHDHSKPAIKCTIEGVAAPDKKAAKAAASNMLSGGRWKVISVVEL